jgi:hypothetical protein
LALKPKSHQGAPTGRRSEAGHFLTSPQIAGAINRLAQSIDEKVAAELTRLNELERKTGPLSER